MNRRRSKLLRKVAHNTAQMLGESNNYNVLQVRRLSAKLYKDLKSRNATGGQ